MTSYDDAGEALEQLQHHWGTAYSITHPQPGVWLAQRRDNREILRAPSADELFAAISRDYTKRPVPRSSTQ